MFAFEHYDIEPDIICLGKGLGGGVMPMAAIVSRESFNIAGSISLGHYTHEKSPLGSVAALAMIEYIESNQLLEKVQEDEIFIREKLKMLKQNYSLIGDVRGIGLLWGIELVKNRETKEKAIGEAEKIMYDCLNNGLSFKVSQGNVLQLCPPLIIDRLQIIEAINIIEQAISSIGLS